MVFGFNLIPREMKFFDMFDLMAATLARTGAKFYDLMTSTDNRVERCLDIKREEEVGDDLVFQIIQALDLSFITPFDREDIHKLSTSMDDVLDNIEETAHRLQEFRIDKPDRASIDLARIIKDSCAHLEQAVRGCRHLKKPQEIQRHIQEIGRLENEADAIYREADGALFANPPDILTLIKYRELYEWQEATVDACKDVALVLTEIVIKGT
jgi:hypothetical protein